MLTIFLLLWAVNLPAIKIFPVIVNGYLEISINMELSNNSLVLQRIEAGLPTSIKYQIEVFESRPFWWDKKIASAEVTIHILAKALSEEYLVNTHLNSEIINSKMVKGKDNLLKVLSVLENIRILKIPNTKINSLLLKVRAVVGQKVRLGIFKTDLSTGWVKQNIYIHEEKSSL